MEFYSLVENENLIAEIVEFENGECAVYWYGINDKLIIYPSLEQFKDIQIYEDRKLIHEGVKEQE